MGHAVNLGTCRATTVDDVAKALARGLAVDAEPERVGRYRAGDIRHRFADPSRAEGLLRFRAGTRLEDGMSELVEWLAEQEAVERVDMATQELVSRGPTR